MSPSQPKTPAGLRLPGLTTQILAAFVLGGLVGWLWPGFGQSLQLLATIFVRLVMVIIAPLIFSTLVVGIAGSGELRKLGGMAARAVGLFLVYTAFALALGFLLANFFQPGQGIPLGGGEVVALAAPPAESFWVRLFPRNALDAMARNDVLQMVVFSLLFGLALASAGEKGKPMLNLCRSLADVMFKFTGLVMLTAPLGVFGAAAAIVGKHGLAVGESFALYVLSVYVGLGLLLLVLFPALCWAFRIPLRRFYHAVKEPFAIAFATASSAAALPKAMENMESFGVPRRIAAFVLPTGMPLNLGGSTLFAGVAALFLLQVFQIPFTAAQQWQLFLTLYVAAKGIAAVPRASLVVIAASLASMGVPAEVTGAGIGLLIGIDAILDMPRTGVNTVGNCLAAALVARWEGAFQTSQRSQPADLPVSSL